jgi:adenylosuccinate lyase
MEVWENGGDFQAALAADEGVSAHLDAAALAELFDVGYHMRHVDAIFARVFA